MLKTRLLSWSYKNIAKPIFFKFDSEFVHEQMLKVGHVLGEVNFTRESIRRLFDYQNVKLNQTIAGIKFPNPIGLAAGFDKNATIVKILPSVGFGFVEIGSITWQPYAGNFPPRLIRLPKSKSIVINYGLSSEGAEKVAKRLESILPVDIPIGTSIAPSNSPEIDTCTKAVEDVLKTYERFKKIGNYTTLNLSCPNTAHDQPFMQFDWLRTLLKEVAAIKTKKSIFIKISPDYHFDHIKQLLNIAAKFPVAVVICSNLTKRRDLISIYDNHIPNKGGLSGKVVEPLTNKLISYVRTEFGDRFAIIGCGGVFSAQDAIKKFELGADLIQLITGMIYEGPQLIGAINHKLAKYNLNDLHIFGKTSGVS